jgi:predicted RNase H-like nuclease (RuvC/YqgF family)
MRCYICNKPAMAELIMCEVCRLKTENKELKEKLEDYESGINTLNLMIDDWKRKAESAERLEKELEAMKAKEDRAAKERDRYLEQLEEWRVT